jgi:hypothetical protein
MGGGIHIHSLSLGTKWTLSGQLHAVASLPWERMSGTHWTGDWVAPQSAWMPGRREKPRPF